MEYFHLAGLSTAKVGDFCPRYGSANLVVWLPTPLSRLFHDFFTSLPLCFGWHSRRATMVEIYTVRTLWKAGIRFYERFVRALFGEHARRPICHLAGPEPHSNESIPDFIRSKSSPVMDLMLPLPSYLALLMLLTAAGVEAQKAVNAPTFHTSVEMVLVPVTVTDHDGRTIEGLRADDFNIFDDRKPQTIASFSSDDAPSSVGLVLDISGSMQQTLSAAKEIAQAFFGSANPKDEFLLLTVSTQPTAMPAFTTDTAALGESISFAKPGGLTALFDTVYLGLSRMREAQWPRRALLILSDGGDNHSRYSEKELMSVALEADVQIYTIVVDNGLAGLGTTITPYRPALIKKPWDRTGERHGPEMLEKLSDQTGGLCFHVSNTDEAKEDAIKAGRALRNEYVIGYRPLDSGTSARWHRIRVKSKASNVHVHARNGYYSLEDASRSHIAVTPQ
ncbi:MAG: hypothetical protein C5B58_15260 [Acidobacteria bacterium]|nr:MAG: hypothetical protein C5B58_15260 [Acidobacteriota bacterium]